MDYSDPEQRYEKGMTYNDKINFSYELEQEIFQNKEDLADVKHGANDPERIKDLEERIIKREKLLQQVQNDIHGINL